MYPSSCEERTVEAAEGPPGVDVVPLAAAVRPTSLEGSTTSEPRRSVQGWLEVAAQGWAAGGSSCRGEQELETCLGSSAGKGPLAGPAASPG